MPPALKQSELTGPTLLAQFRAEGRAISWSVSRRGTKSPNLTAWQEWIAYHAKLAYGPGIEPYEGPVGVSAWFYLRPPVGQQQTPDTTNLFKAFEDALQRVVYLNDKMVVGSHPERIIIAPHDEECVCGQVWAIPRGDCDPDYPGPYNYRPWLWSPA